jgi:hypothetical protein
LSQNIYIDYPRLQERCFAAINDFHGEGTVTSTPDGIYIFRDAGSPVLAVAHLDTIQDVKHFRLIEENGCRLENPQLDDRLGAYIILDLLPSVGIKTDILLTEGEETHCSTAQHFKSDKQYHWMFSFDRGGTDVVMYQYDSDDMRHLLEAEDFVVGKGTGSDIQYLEHLGCKGFNFGCAYYDRHSENAFALLDETTLMIEKFASFFRNYEAVSLAHMAST